MIFEVNSHRVIEGVPMNACGRLVADRFEMLISVVGKQCIRVIPAHTDSECMHHIH